MCFSYLINIIVEKVIEHTVIATSKLAFKLLGSLINCIRCPCRRSTVSSTSTVASQTVSSTQSSTAVYPSLDPPVNIYPNIAPPYPITEQPQARPVPGLYTHQELKKRRADASNISLLVEGKRINASDLIRYHGRSAAATSSSSGPGAGPS